MARISTDEIRVSQLIDLKFIQQSACLRFNANAQEMPHI